MTKNNTTGSDKVVSAKAATPITRRDIADLGKSHMRVVIGCVANASTGNRSAVLSSTAHVVDVLDALGDRLSTQSPDASNVRALVEEIITDHAGVIESIAIEVRAIAAISTEVDGNVRARLNAVLDRLNSILDSDTGEVIDEPRPLNGTVKAPTELVALRPTDQ